MSAGKPARGRPACLRQLRAARVTVETRVLADEAAELMAPFLTYTRRRRPCVIAKWAQSLDGKLATWKGDSRWISGRGSRRQVHRLRFTRPPRVE